jgi:hypothetical protein
VRARPRCQSIEALLPEKFQNHRKKLKLCPILKAFQKYTLIMAHFESIQKYTLTTIFKGGEDHFENKNLQTGHAGTSHHHV